MRFRTIGWVEKFCVQRAHGLHASQRIAPSTSRSVKPFSIASAAAAPAKGSAMPSADAAVMR